ncbi:virulence factor SrfC family protein, partial [Stenotrophomonas maltophilia]|uniref:virulence factor SrfC family protein n=2 Tax=Stenotrophomonas maltophilia TaxID=40324 RepID=UPI00195364B4
VVESAESASPKIALISARRINAMVGDLGFGKLPASERPEVEANGLKRRAFAERPIVHQALGIGTEPVDHAGNFATDWFFGFMKVVEDNAQE